MKTKLLLLAVCFSLLANQLPAQNFGNKLKNKVVNKMEQKAEEKANKAIDSAIDKPVDKTEEKVKQSVKEGSSGQNTQSTGSSAGEGQAPDNAQMQQYMEMMGGGAVTIEDYPAMDEIKPSPWTGSFDMVTSGMDKNGKPLKDQAGEISWHIDKYDVAMIPDAGMNGQKQDMRMVIKRKQGIMLILTEDKGKKTGMVMKMKTISVDLGQTEIEEKMEGIQVEVNRGITKTVNGLLCYQVKAWSDEFESLSWVSDKVGISFQDLMSFMNVKGQNSAYEKEFGHIKGIPVQTVSKDKKSGDVHMMDIKSINAGQPDQKWFSSDGYELMQLPDIGNGAFGGYGGQ